MSVTWKLPWHTRASFRLPTKRPALWNDPNLLRVLTLPKLVGRRCNGRVQIIKALGLWYKLNKEVAGHGNTQHVVDNDREGRRGGREKVPHSPHPHFSLESTFKGCLWQANGAVPWSLTARYQLVNTPGLCQIPTNDFSAQIKWSECFLMAAAELHDSFQENLQK